jgi:hypothetical protein
MTSRATGASLLAFLARQSLVIAWQFCTQPGSLQIQKERRSRFADLPEASQSKGHGGDSEGGHGETGRT